MKHAFSCTLVERGQVTAAAAKGASKIGIRPPAWMFNENVQSLRDMTEMVTCVHIQRGHPTDRCSSQRASSCSQRHRYQGA
eukprot:652437-Pelagomonas_calceolata.AAC.1